MASYVPVRGIHAGQGRQAASPSQNNFAHNLPAGMPPGMPDFTAPVIRINQQDRNGGRGGAEQYGNRNHAGLGSGNRPNLVQPRKNLADLHKPTREEVKRTIFIGGLAEGAPPDPAFEAMLECAGKLRRWKRAMDADKNKCQFGFAEYEDVESLETAKMLFQDGFEVPMFENSKVVYEDDDPSKQAKTMKLDVIIDEQSSDYIDEWMSKRNENEENKAFRLQNAQDGLNQYKSQIANGGTFLTVKSDEEEQDAWENLNRFVNGEYIPDIDLSEFVDIPAEQKATIAEEIKAFRLRSLSRNDEVLRKSDLVKSDATKSSGVNSAPLGPRSAVPGAPPGPKSQRNAEAASSGAGVDDDSDASDFTLEQRRLEQRKIQQDKAFASALRQYSHDDAPRMADLRRKRAFRDDEARRLERWNDDEDDRSRRNEYHRSFESWRRQREAARYAEARKDDRDRDDARRESRGNRHDERATTGRAAQRVHENDDIESGNRDRADTFDLQINLGTGNSRKSGQTTASLLDAEDEAAENGGSIRVAQPSSEVMAERAALAKEIPTERDELFATKVHWKYVTPKLIDREIRPFVEKQIITYLGTKEDLVVNLVINGLKDEKDAEQVTDDLATILDEIAIEIIRKVWRMVVYWSEAGVRGLI